MKQTFSRLLVVGLLLVACSGAVWGDGLKVTITKKGGDKVTKEGQDSLAMAFKGLALKEVEGIEVSGGDFRVADWNWLKANSKNLSDLKIFVVTDDVNSVADIPDTDDDEPYYFGRELNVLHIAKLKKVGKSAFYYRYRLTCVSLPSATHISDGAFARCHKVTSMSLPAAKEIGDLAFRECISLKKLQLGATPPSKVGKSPFLGSLIARKLELINSDSTALTGSALDNAKSLYKAVNDGDTEDNLWYGFAFEKFPASNLSGTIDGVAFTNAASLETAMQGKTLDNVKKLTIMGGTFQVSDWGFLQDQGRYKLKIEQFTIENSVARVADIPDLESLSPAYLPSAQFVRIAKVQNVGTCAFFSCSSLESVSLPAATNIGKSAFWYCTSLKNVSLPVATNIGESAFEFCDSLKDVSLPAATYIDRDAFRNCQSLESVSLPAVTYIGREAFRNCQSLESVSLPAVTHTNFSVFKECLNLKSVSLPNVDQIAPGMFEKCSSLRTLKLGAEPPIAGYHNFEDCPSMRTLLITDARGVPLVGPDLDAAIPRYDTIWREPADGMWFGWTIEKYPPSMLTVIVEPAGAGEITITRKDGGAVVNSGDWLPKGKTLVVTTKHNSGYKHKMTTAVGARDNGNNEWKITAEPGEQVVFTVEFEKVTTLGTTIFMPTDCGIVRIARKDGGAVVNEGDELKKGETLVVTAKNNGGYKHKKTTAVGAKDIGNNEWEVTANPGEQVVFTVEFEKAITLGAPIINPAEGGTVSITRKANGAVVNENDELKKGDTLVVTATQNDGYKYKETKAVGADDKGNNEWEVKAELGEQVIFTVTFENKQKGEGGNNNNEPTPVESALLAQARLFPNPTGGQVTVDAGSAVARCEVYTGTGALLQTIESPESVFTIDLTANPSGVYLLRLVDVNGESKTLRAVKQ